MNVDTRVDGNKIEAIFTDSISFSDHDAFRKVVEDIANSGATECIFDLTGLQSIDSAGLGMFMIAKDEAKKGGWQITLRSPRGPVKTIMELSRFDKLFNIQP